jgi:hypothetical protein
MHTRDVPPGPVRDALRVREAGHIRRSIIVGALAEMIADLFYPHLRGHSRARHAERAAETAAIVGPVQGYQDEALTGARRSPILLKGGPMISEGFASPRAKDRPWPLGCHWHVSLPSWRAGRAHTRAQQATQQYRSTSCAKFRPGSAPSPHGVLQGAMSGIRQLGGGRWEGPSGQTVTNIFDRCRDAVSAAKAHQN